MKSRDGKVFRILEDIATLVAGGSLIPPNFQSPNFMVKLTNDN
jgi:hypothetical protein